MMSARRLAAGLVALLLLAGALTTAIARRDESPPPASGSTRAGTWVDRDGDGTLERGAGESLVARTELARAAPPVRELGVLALFGDAHVRDEESPARAPQLDRLGRPFESTFRPQETLTAQTLAGAVASINRVRPDAVLEIGDLIDNAQQNELDTALAVLRGGTVDPSSGARGYDGPQAASNPDPLFYRPDVDAPRHPGLLARAQRPFRSEGLRAPWYPIVGNHDVLVDGEVAPTRALEALAVGGRLPVELDPAVRESARERRLSPAVVDQAIEHGLRRSRPVPSDPRRRLLSARETVDSLRAASGHGGTGPRMDYAFDVGSRLRVIAIDLIDRGGGPGGAASKRQLAWLRRELQAAAGRWVLVVTHRPLRASTGGARVLRELDRSPRVLAALAGDTHRNSIAPRHSEAGGYWRIGTASLADYPQQARAIRVVETAGGGVALETWMLDTASSPLVDTARQLAYLDAQGGRPAGFAGKRADRNARLYR
jgi:Calcineurin-like phosphoesterase